MRGKLGKLSDALLILSASLGIAGTLSDHGIVPSLLFAQSTTPVDKSSENSLNERINSLLQEDISFLLTDFTPVIYDSQRSSDNLQQLLNQENVPTVVFLYNSVGGVDISKTQAVVLKLLKERELLPIRFVAFSYEIIPGSRQEKNDYLRVHHGFSGSPTTQLYVPSTIQGSNMILLDSRFGSPTKSSDIAASLSDIPEYWFSTNLFQSGERTVYRFLDTYTWHELRADGRGNIIDPAQENRVIGRDVDPELVRQWNELRTQQEQSQNSPRGERR